MKLKITRTIKVANPTVSKPHYCFSKEQLLDTDNEYLITTLLDNNFAKKAKEEKMKGEHKNKSLNEPTLNKSIE